MSLFNIKYIINKSTGQSMTFEEIRLKNAQSSEYSDFKTRLNAINRFISDLDDRIKGIQRASHTYLSSRQEIQDLSQLRQLSLLLKKIVNEIGNEDLDYHLEILNFMQLKMLQYTAYDGMKDQLVARLNNLETEVDRTRANVAKHLLALILLSGVTAGAISLAICFPILPVIMLAAVISFVTVMLSSFLLCSPCSSKHESVRNDNSELVNCIHELDALEIASINKYCNFKLLCDQSDILMRGISQPVLGLVASN